VTSAELDGVTMIVISVPPIDVHETPHRARHLLSSTSFVSIHTRFVSVPQ